MSLSTFLSRMQRYPKPESADELDALIVLNAPFFKAIAKELVSGDLDALKSGCQEVLDTLSQPSSPYSAYTDLPTTQDVALSVKKAFCDQLREQGSQQQVEAAIYVFSRLEGVCVNVNPLRNRKP